MTFTHNRIEWISEEDFKPKEQGFYPAIFSYDAGEGWLTDSIYVECDLTCLDLGGYPKWLIHHRAFATERDAEKFADQYCP